MTPKNEQKLKQRQDEMRGRMRSKKRKWPELARRLPRRFDPGAVLCLTAREVEAFSGHLVFAWFRYGVLQSIGSSYSITHCLNPVCDEVRIFPCDSRKDALLLEEELIQLWKPPQKQHHVDKPERPRVVLEPWEDYR